MASGSGGEGQSQREPVERKTTEEQDWSDWADTGGYPVVLPGLQPQPSEPVYYQKRRKNIILFLFVLIELVGAILIIAGEPQVGLPLLFLAFGGGIATAKFL